MVELEGLTILEKRQVVLTENFISAFYSEHRHKAFYPKLHAFMSSGPTCALLLAGNDAVARWRAMMGPTNTDAAKTESPTSMRALFGTGMHGRDSSSARLCGHGSCPWRSISNNTCRVDHDLPSAVAILSSTRACTSGATCEIALFFPHAASAPPDRTPGSLPAEVEAALVDALTEFARERPSSDPTDATQWLSKWLQEHGLASSEGVKPRPHVVSQEAIPADAIDDEADFAPYVEAQRAALAQKEEAAVSIQSAMRGRRDRKLVRSSSCCVALTCDCPSPCNRVCGSRRAHQHVRNTTLYAHKIW
jgi:nucleoside diphosphate kinase